MTTKYKRIVLLNNPAALNNSELAQRIAFTHEYSWIHYGKSIITLSGSRDLLFDPNQKTIHSINYAADHYSDCIVVKEISGLNDALKTPSLALDIVEDGPLSATIGEGKITFKSKRSRLVGCVTVTKEFVRKVMKEDRSTNSLPIVRFSYPGGTGFSPITRVIKLAKMDNEFIYGFEMVRGSENQSDEPFKKYSLNRIDGEVIVQSFNNK